MRFAFGCCVAFLLLSAGQGASRTIDLGPASVEADMTRNENCTVGADEELCAAVLESNGTTDPGDDEVWHDKSVDELVVHVRDSPSNQSHDVTVRPDNLVLAHPTFALANDSWLTLDESLPGVAHEHANLESSWREDNPGDQLDTSTWGLSVDAHPLGMSNTRVWVLCWDLSCGHVWWGAFASEEDGIRFTSFVGSAAPWDSDPWLQGLLEGASTCYLSVWRDVGCPEAVLSLLGQHGHVLVASTTTATPEVHAFSHVNGTSVQVEEKAAHTARTLQSPGTLVRVPSKALPVLSGTRELSPSPSPPGSGPAHVFEAPTPTSSAPTSPPGPPTGLSTAQVKPLDQPAPLAVMASVATALAAILVAFYTRLCRDRVLEHKTRKVVYDAICQEPGIRVGTIACRLGLDHKAVQHHVGILQDFSLVKMSGPANNRLLPVGQLSSAEEDLCAGALASPTARLVYDLLVSSGPRDLKGVAAALGLTYSTASAVCVRLRKAGLVRRERRWRQWVLAPTLGPKPHVGSPGQASLGNRPGLVTE